MTPLTREDNLLTATTKCRACGAPIAFARTEKNKRIPLDPDPYTGPEPSGLFVLRDGAAIAVPPDAFPDEPHYRSHWATCTDPGRFRR
jgi:hypothetical protein